MINNVFTIDECNDIINEEFTLKHVDKAKNKIINYLRTKNITVDKKYLNFLVYQDNPYGSDVWHYDDDYLINFIVNIKGDGTQILDKENNTIIELKQGDGYMIIGGKGYLYLGLDPTLFRYPSYDNGWLHFCITLRTPECVFGNNVTKYNSPEYKSRNKKIRSMLLDDIAIIKSSKNIKDTA